jgi:hypothetical protein
MINRIFPPASHEGIRSALQFVPADDRKIWLDMTMAIKSELGEAGLDMWLEWRPHPRPSEKETP